MSWIIKNPDSPNRAQRRKRAKLRGKGYTKKK